MPLPTLCHRPFFKKFRADRRGVNAVEAGIILPVFLVFLLVLFEVSYDQFLQGVVESAVQITAYKMQVGETANTTSAQAFIDNDLCPNAIAGLLNCGNLYVRVQQFDSSATCTDFNADTGNNPVTTGTLPVSGGVLQLGDYAGDGTTAAIGSAVGPTACEEASGTDGIGFCNPGPNEYIIMSVVYLAPTFLYGLLPGQGYRYNGNFVHAAFATSAFYTENFAALTAGPLCYKPST